MVKQKKKLGRPKGSKNRPQFEWRKIKVRVAAPPPKPVGSPGKYTDKIAKEICMEIATTTRGLQEICDANPPFPSPKTIYTWLTTKPDFLQMYESAKRAQAQLLAEEIITISNTPKMGQITTTAGKDEKGKPIIKEVKVLDMLEHRKLQVDARKWMAARLLPKKYGERLAVDDGRDPLKELIDSLNAQHDISASPPEVKPPEPSVEIPAEPKA